MYQAARQLLRPPAGMAVDFRRPAGAAALTPADGVSWQVFANPVTLFIGGITAVLLELAEPSVRTGVWTHSSFRRDPINRLHRTGYAAMVTVYAPKAQAEAMIARVVRMHAKVQGHTPNGQPYAANDPRLLNWVHATAVFGFTEAFHHYARALTLFEKDSAFEEAQASAQLYGANDLPNTWEGWEQLLACTSARLEDHPIMAEFLHIMRQTPLLPRPLQALQGVLIQAAIDITPAPVRQWAAPQGQVLSRWQRTLVKTLAGAACHVPIPQLPPYQARQRMRV